MGKLLKRIFPIFIGLILLSMPYLSGVQQNVQIQPDKDRWVANSINSLPLYFVENRGQVDECVNYILKISNTSVYFGPDEVVYQFVFKKRTKESKTGGIESQKDRTREDMEIQNIRMIYWNTNQDVSVQGLEEKEARFSYFRGNDPEKWVKGARSYEKVLYRELYPFVDLEVSGTRKRIKHEYRIRAGGDVENIRIGYEGIDRLSINGKGQLEIEAGEVTLIEDVPLSYQTIDGERVEVGTEYVIHEDNTLGFRVAEYRQDLELVIDPWIVIPFMIFSTYLGGTDADNGWGVSFDKNGNVYVTGVTSSANFPLKNPFQNFLDDIDAFVTKLDPTGANLLYSTFIGGTDPEESHAIVVDDSGCAHITGVTHSLNGLFGPYPTTPGAFSRDQSGDGDAFYTKFSSSGTSLEYSTYFGGSGSDVGYGIAIDGNGDAFIVGESWSSDLPTTTGAFDTTYNTNGDAFVTKINASGSHVLYSTFLGGSGFDSGKGIAVDAGGNIYIAGRTASSDFPTSSGAYDKVIAGGDAFVVKIDPQGSGLGDLVYSTFLGGSFQDNGEAIAVDSSGNAYVTGDTRSSDFPLTSDAYDSIRNGRDAFISKIDPGLSGSSSLVYSTFLGGGGSEFAYGIEVDTIGNVYIMGGTDSNDFPVTPDTYGPLGGMDAYFTILNIPDNKILYSTHLGGSSMDYGMDVAVDSAGNACGTGWTYSSDMFTTGSSFSGDCDVFIVKAFFLYVPLVSVQLKVFDGHDFSGDGSSDVSVWRPSNGKWYIRNMPAQAWGTSGDIPVNGDYDGDGTTDIAVWRPSSGKWYIKGIGSYLWGMNGDVPVPGDYDGDGTTDIAVWRPSNGRWYIKGIGSYLWGMTGDIAVPGDYNKNGNTDIAVWRPSNGKWFIKGVGTYAWGMDGDLAVPCDYNNDGITDMAVWRQTAARWYIRNVGSYAWGIVGDVPTPGDYNGDGQTDIAVWRPSNARWYIKGIGGYFWGTFGDIPLVR